MTKVEKIIIVLLIIPIIVIAAFVAQHVYHVHRLESGYQSISVGTSKETVIRIMGADGDLEMCTADGCRDTLTYSTFMQRWIIDFDGDGKVIYKVHHEGSF